MKKVYVVIGHESNFNIGVATYIAGVRSTFKKALELLIDEESDIDVSCEIEKTYVDGDGNGDIKFSRQIINSKIKEYFDCEHY